MAKQPKLKIALVVDDGLDKPDGVQQYVLAIGEWLRSQGHEVDYLAGETTRTDLEHVYSLAKNVHVKSNGNNLSVPLPANKKRIRALLRDKSYDVLHVQVPHSPFMAQRVILAASDTTAIVGTFHIAPYNRLIWLGNWLLGWWLRPSLKRFDTLVSVSSAGAQFAQETFHMSTDILPNVVDYQRFSTAEPFPRYNDNTPTVLFLGRLVPRKGCKVLLEAIQILHMSQPELQFRVVICGSGPELDTLQKYVAHNQLTSFVEFVGFVTEEDKPRYYASADISVFPSSGGESFGIVLLEAMASGSSVVLAGDNPGYRSVMESQISLLFDPHDPRELSKKLELYLKKGLEHQKMAEWGAAYTRQFDTATVGAKLLKLYESALRKRRNG